MVKFFSISSVLINSLILVSEFAFGYISFLQLQVFNPFALGVFVLSVVASAVAQFFSLADSNVALETTKLLFISQALLSLTILSFIVFMHIIILDSKNLVIKISILSVAAAFSSVPILCGIPFFSLANSFVSIGGGSDKKGG